MIILDDLENVELEQIHIDELTNIPLIKGDKGDKGDKGEAFKYEDFTEEQLEELKGPKGDTGPANTLTIGTVESGDSTSVSITGNAPNQVLNFILEKGNKGDKRRYW